MWGSGPREVFACDGDAGAAVVNADCQVLGLLWSGGVFGYASPIDAVLGPQGCNVELVTDQTTCLPVGSGKPYRVPRLRG